MNDTINVTHPALDICKTITTNGSNTIIYHGDALEVLKQLPTESVDCCLTSPPYYALRSYGVDGQLGLEGTPQEYVNRLADVFDEVRRVLKKSGVCFLNIADTYFSKTKGSGGSNPETSFVQIGKGIPNKQAFDPKKISAGDWKLKEKDLCGIPWRVAIELQNRGWYLRQDIILSRKTPMPNPVKDRCVTAHEYVFLLTKSPKYYFDYIAIQEKAATKPYNGGHKNGDEFSVGPMDRGGKGQKQDPDRIWGSGDKRNKWSVWHMSSGRYSGGHFAVMSSELAKTAILAGCPQGGKVLDPFFGVGTTGGMANYLGRDCVGIELNQDYINAAEDRVLSLAAKGK